MPVADAPAGELPVSELQALQGELAGLMTGMRKLQLQLRQATQAADERTSLLQAKIEELEAQNLSRALEIRQLEQENEGLHRVVEAKAPELARVIRERNDALKELSNAHKFIEDLLSHQEAEEAPPDVATRRASKQITLAPAKKLQHPQREIPVESDDESTIRPARSVASVSIGPVTHVPLTKTNAVNNQRTVTRTSSVETAVSTSSVADSPKNRKTGKKRLHWYLEFEKCPATSVSHGPIPFNVLADRLVLDDDMIRSIWSLEFESGYDIRVHAEADTAFVYRPVILESLSATYLIGWGDAAMVRKVQEWSNGIGEVNLFSYPAKEDSESGWFYLGKHKLTYTPIKSIWSKLPEEDTEKLLAELKDRNPDMDASKFRRDVMEGRLVQCCIQLENVGNKVESLEFLKEYGLLPSDGRLA